MLPRAALMLMLASLGCRSKDAPKDPAPAAAPRLEARLPPIGSWSVVARLGPERAPGAFRVHALTSSFRRAVIWRQIAVDLLDADKQTVSAAPKPPECALGARPFEHTDDPVHLVRVRLDYDDVFFDAGARCGYHLEKNAWVPVPVLALTAGTVVTELEKGDLLLTGGSAWSDANGGASVPHAEASRWVGKTGATVKLPPMAVSRMRHSALRLLDGSVLLLSRRGELVELFEPSKNAFRSLGEQSASGVPTLMKDGRVLFLEPQQCAVFDALAGTWSPCRQMPTPRRDFATTTLEDGRILVSGGFLPADAGMGPALSVAEVYDPHLDAWHASTTMPAASALHDSVRLSDGRVLVVGGLSRGVDGAATPVAEVLVFTPPKA